MTKKDYHYWKEMADRYFEAETTDREELMLKRFVSSKEATSPEWDELRAVMGYTVLGKQVHKETDKKASVRQLTRRTRIAVAAAILAGLVAIPAIHRMTIQEAEDQDICFAYVNGNRVTDPALVMQAMHRAMSHVQQVDPITTVEGQLESIFELIK
ncbi:MAG: hypothetical protein IKU98_02845 [Bacteroidaceae bacterium]|nr:hypothetical protein [Bacteroidaceae bacterium]